MNLHSRIIVFCYAYIVGIVAAMLAPADPQALSMLHVLTSLVFLAAFILLGRMFLQARKATPDKPYCTPSWQWLVLIIPALALGYTRFIASDAVPDSRLGSVRVVEGKPILRIDAQLPDTSRVRIRKTEAIETDIQLRLKGRLDARVPVTDERGVPVMDDHGRWRFRIARLQQASEFIVIRKDDPVGTDYFVPQPFNVIDGVEMRAGPSSGAISLHRISNHIGSFVREGRGGAAVTILGRISQDPLVYDFKTVLPVTPEFIQYPAGGPFYKVEGGDVQVTIRPAMTGYRDFARTDAYGYDVRLSGELGIARAASNPGGFDARRFMHNYNIYGLVNVFQAPGMDAPMDIVSRRRGNLLVEFSLDLRDRMLKTIKLTLPYPHSAFLGGVTLGLRYGLQGTLCMFSDTHRTGRLTRPATDDDAEIVVHQDCEQTIADEFKASGVNHVLAVSGLHVTIITVMFIGIFTLLKLKPKAYVPLIILALVIFAIITGSRPSVLRAVIMNSLFLLTWAYLDQSLRASALLGVPVAAFLILLQNPLVLVDPSFTLSFGAILSLALVTGPVHEILGRLHGNSFLAFFIAGLSLTLLAILHWPLLITPSFGLLFVAFVVLLFVGARWLDRRNVHLIRNLGYSDIPAGAAAFFAAQFAIQLGMMIPLSSYYFARWPLAGAYANLIAIPLIGIVVQLGAIAGLIGLIPQAGVYVALLLNAANWLSSAAFLWIAHVSTKWIPYPFVRRGSVPFLVTYYLLCVLFVWHKSLWRLLQTFCERHGFSGRRAPFAAFASIVVIALIPMTLSPSRAAPRGQLRITVFSVGYGSSILIETPGGKHVLVDAGFVEHERGRRNEAIRTILPALCYQGIRHLDALILTSPLAEHSAGASYVLDHTWVDELWLPPALAGLAPDMTFADFADSIARGDSDSGDSRALQNAYDELVGNRSWPARPALAKSLTHRSAKLLNKWAGWGVRRRVLAGGTTVLAETIDGREFRIEVPASPATDALAVVRIGYGDFAMLLPSDLGLEGQTALANLGASDLAAQVMIAPHHGTAAPASNEANLKQRMDRSLRASLDLLMDKVAPDYVVFEYGNLKPVLGPMTRDMEHAYELTFQHVSDRLPAGHCLSTDRDMAVFITSDGRSYKVDTQSQRNRGTGTGEDSDDMGYGGF
ncbi:MAG TPA: ComEC/Rec2 family competence protein [Kiritimatiellia bacterium]|nr:ComEC/Rec2 family competence protein [Kiritimatiellia bacterium]